MGGNWRGLGSVKPIYPLNHAAETQSALIQWINGFDKKQAGGHWSPLWEITQFPRIFNSESAAVRPCARAVSETCIHF